MLQGHKNMEEHSKQTSALTDISNDQTVHSDEYKAKIEDMTPSIEDQKKRKLNEISDSNINKELRIMKFAKETKKNMPVPSRHKKPKKADLI